MHSMREVVAGISGRWRFLVNSTELVFFHLKLFFTVRLLFAFGAGFVGAAVSVVRVSIEVSGYSNMSDLLCEVVGARKCFATVRADIWPFLCVCAHMAFQMLQAFEEATTGWDRA